MSNLDIYTNYKTVLSVNALIWCKGKVLLLKRSETKKIDPGVYSGVGGKIEPHEDVYNALLREIEEETGIKNLKNIRLFSITQHPFPPTDSEWVNFYFTAEIDEQVLIENSSEGEFYWIDPKDVENLPMVTDLKIYIPTLAKNPKTFVLGFFDHDKEGKLIDKKIRMLE